MFDDWDYDDRMALCLLDTTNPSRRTNKLFSVKMAVSHCLDGILVRPVMSCNLSADERSTASGYLADWGGKLFPFYFHTLLHPFISALQPLDADDRIDAIEREFPSLVETIVGPGLEARPTGRRGLATPRDIGELLLNNLQIVTFDDVVSPCPFHVSVDHLLSLMCHVLLACFALNSSNHF